MLFRSGLAGAVRPEAVVPDAVALLLRPALDALPHLPRVVLGGPLLDRAVRGGLLSDEDLGKVEPAPASAAAAAERDGAVVALDPTGAIVGILGRLPRGTWRLRPNFRGLG